MPTKKIADSPESRVCLNPEHNPPKFRVWSPGRYEHTCPGCGFVQFFTVPRITNCCWKGGPGPCVSFSV
jgi:hypothetical protein